MKTKQLVKHLNEGTISLNEVNVRLKFHKVLVENGLTPSEANQVINEISYDTIMSGLSAMGSGAYNTIRNNSFVKNMLAKIRGNEWLRSKVVPMVKDPTSMLGSLIKKADKFDDSRVQRDVANRAGYAMNTTADKTIGSTNNAARIGIAGATKEIRDNPVLNKSVQDIMTQQGSASKDTTPVKTAGQM